MNAEQHAHGTGPLSGFRIIELAGIGPGPYCGQLLADMGAELIVVERPGAERLPVKMRGKQSIVLDLRKPAAAEIVLRMVESADALFEGNRPGVTERLGIGPEDCHARNPRLVYGRMTGWGQHGHWSSMAGHDINYLSITGALYAMGSGTEPPPVPLNLVGDYGGGSLFLATGILAALLKVSKTGKGEVVDASITDGVHSMMSIVHSLHAMQRWQTKRQSNWLDGGVPFYRCYRTSDQQFMAVGALEPQFFAELLRVLEIAPEDYGAQHDQNRHTAQHQLLEQAFAGQTRDYWAAKFDNVDACVTPVLNYREAAEHPHNKDRQALTQIDGISHPNIAPRFGNAGDADINPVSGRGADTVKLLASLGYDNTQIERLLEDKTAIDN